MDFKIGFRSIPFCCNRDLMIQWSLVASMFLEPICLFCITFNQKFMDAHLIYHMLI